MPRKPAFSFAVFSVQMQPSMARAFPVADGVTNAMQDVLDRLSGPRDLSLSGRLDGLKRLFDDDAQRRGAIGTA